MASEKTEEERELEAELQAMTERKKRVFETTKEADENLRKIREEEMKKQQRLERIKAERIERDMRERHAARLEAEKKTQVTELEHKAAILKSEFARVCKERNETLDKLKNLETEHEQLKAERSRDMTELQTLRCRNESLMELKDNLQHITSLSKDQQQTIACLEDKIVATQKVSAETQLRQLNELESPSEETKKLKKTLATAQHPADEQPRRGNQQPYDRP